MSQVCDFWRRLFFPVGADFMLPLGEKAIYWRDELENGGALRASDFLRRLCYAGGVCLGVRRIVGAAVGFIFVDVAFRLWVGCCWCVSVFLSGRSMRLRS